MSIESTGEFSGIGDKGVSVRRASCLLRDKPTPITIKPTKGMAIRLVGLTYQSQSAGVKVVGSERGEVIAGTLMSSSGAAEAYSGAFSISQQSAQSTRSASAAIIPYVEFSIGEVVTIDHIGSVASVNYSFLEVQ